MKCDVCGKRFVPKKEAIYKVDENACISGILPGMQKAQDAIDCPKCGCQHVLKERLPKLEGGE